MVHRVGAAAASSEEPAVASASPRQAPAGADGAPARFSSTCVAIVRLGPVHVCGRLSSLVAGGPAHACGQLSSAPSAVPRPNPNRRPVYISPSYRWSPRTKSAAFANATLEALSFAPTPGCVIYRAAGGPEERQSYRAAATAVTRAWIRAPEARARLTAS